MLIVYTHTYVFIHKLYTYAFSMVNMIQLPSGLYFLRECRPNSQPPQPQLRAWGCCLVPGEIGTPSHAHPDRLLGLGKWRAWGRGKHPCRVVSLSKDQREWEIKQLMPQMRTRVHECSITGKEGHSRGSSCCYHPQNTQKGTWKRIQFLSRTI